MRHKLHRLRLAMGFRGHRIVAYWSDLMAADRNDLCWSCGLRGQHKLWCPNR